MSRDQLERLIEAHQALLYRYIRFLGAQPAVAEDLVQETFLATLRLGLRCPGNGADDPGWAAWLRGVARNLFLAHCRKQRQRDAAPIEQVDVERADALWLDRCGSDELWHRQLEALEHCLSYLSSIQRDMVKQRYASQLGRDAMARKFGMSEDGIKTALRRIRAQLAQCITDRCLISER